MPVHASVLEGQLAGAVPVAGVCCATEGEQDSCSSRLNGGPCVCVILISCGRLTVADKEGAVGVWDLTRPAPARAGRRRCSNICSTRRGSLNSSCRRRAARSICQLAQRVHQAHYYSSRRKSCLHTSRNGPTVHHTCSRFRLEEHTNTVRLSAMRHACLWPRVCALAPHVNTLGLLNPKRPGADESARSHVIARPLQA